MLIDRNKKMNVPAYIAILTIIITLIIILLHLIFVKLLKSLVIIESLIIT